MWKTKYIFSGQKRLLVILALICSLAYPLIQALSNSLNDNKLKPPVHSRISSNNRSTHPNVGIAMDHPTAPITNIKPSHSDQTESNGQTVPHNELDSVNTNVSAGETSWNEATREFYKLDTVDALKYIGNALTNEHVQTRLQAVSVLTGIKHPATQGLWISLLQDEHPQVREHAIVSLGDIGSGVDVEIIEQALNDTSNAVILAALETLAKWGSEDSAHAIGPLLYHRDPNMRTHAVKALGDLSCKTADHYLRQALSDPEPSIRQRSQSLLY